MNRLQSELRRLYLPRSPTLGEDGTPTRDLIDAGGTVRAMVMELTRPPSWSLLSRVWQGAQTELDLSAPAIAVSGIDGLQLWFSLAEPIVASQAHAFLESLRLRFLPDVDSRRVRLMPASDASALRPGRHAMRVPALQETTGNWSAFVAADLAPIFADTPWLDIPPNEEGQANLLRGVSVINPSQFGEALQRLEPITPGADLQRAHAEPMTAAADEDPARFLRRVMNDDTVALALRIEAAKALLQHSNDRPPQPGG